MQGLGPSLRMFSRGSQPASSSNAPPEVDFQEDLEDLYADNVISAQRTAKLLHKASKAGIEGISKKVHPCCMASTGSASSLSDVIEVVSSFAATEKDSKTFC